MERRPGTETEEVFYWKKSAKVIRYCLSPCCLEVMTATTSCSGQRAAFVVEQSWVTILAPSLLVHVTFEQGPYPHQV